MKIKNYGLLEMFTTLDGFANKKLPQRLSYAITKNIMNIKPDFECYNKEIKKLVEQYDDKMIKDADGNIRFNKSGIPLVKPEYASDFSEALNELLNIEVELNIYYVDDSIFNYDDSNKYDVMSAMDIFKLQDIMCKKEETEKPEN